MLNAVNVPQGDDLYCLLLFTQSFQDAKTWKECLRLLFEQWVEHRIVYSRLTALASYWLHGTLNFKTVILIGNLSLVGITFIFYKLLRKFGLNIYYLIPVTLTLFSPVMYEGNLWAGASTVYMPVCFLGILCIYLLTIPSNIAFVSALLTAILATYSFGNGMFTFVAGFSVLLYLRKNKKALIWMLVGFLAVLIYFKGFEMHSATNAFGWAVHFRHPEYLFYNFFAFVGGIFNYYENINGLFASQNLLAVLTGITFTAICAWGVKTLLLDRKDNPQASAAWLGIALYAGITSIAIAYSRTTSEQMTAISSRYKVYSMIIFVLVYLWCLTYFKKKKLIGGIFLGISAGLLLFNYFVYYEKFVNYKSYSMAGLHNYTNNGKWMIYRESSYFEGASKMICDTIQSKSKPVFHFEKPVFPELSYSTLNKSPFLSDVQITRNKDLKGKSPGTISITSNEFPATPNLSEGAYLVLYNKSEIILLVAGPLKNGRLAMVRQGRYFKNGFYIHESLHSIIQKGKVYKLAIFCPTEKEKIRRINYELAEL
jgi:hypothetical protein